jgi:hypothetical protein
MSAHVLPPLAVNNKSERKVNLLPPLGFELVIIEMLAQPSNHSAKSHPIIIIIMIERRIHVAAIVHLATHVLERAGCSGLSSCQHTWEDRIG